MARGRFIADTVAKDARLNSLSVEAELVYLMAIPHLDRDGLIEGDPDTLWGTVCPRRRPFLDHMAIYIQEWARAGLVLMYDSPEGTVLWFRGFAKNQMGLRYDREAPSRFPPPPGYERGKDGLQPSEPPNAPTTNGNDTMNDNRGSTPDQLRTNSGPTPDQPKSPEQAPQASHRVYPNAGEYLPGLPMPKRHHERLVIDNLSKQRDRAGLSAEQLTRLTDAVLDGMNASMIAELETDQGTAELRQAQETALNLAVLNHKTPEAIATIFDTWWTHDWRGQKGEAPSYRQIVEHAKSLDKKVEARAKAAAQPQMSDEQKAALRTKAKLAMGNLATAKKFKGAIDPAWEQDIARARGAGVL